MSSPHTTPCTYTPSLPQPPTSNNLDAPTRARLVRSTRKLGAILGTTPHLVELDLHALPAIPRASANGSLREAMEVVYRPETPVDDGEVDRKKARRHASVFNIFPLNGSTSSLESLDSVYSYATAESSFSTSTTSTSTLNSSVTSLTLDSDSDTPRTSIDSTTSYDSTSSFFHDAHPKPTLKSSLFSKTLSRTTKPRPLVLRLNAIPVAPSDPRLPSSPLPTTTTSSSPPHTTSTSSSSSSHTSTPKTTFFTHSHDVPESPLTPVFPSQGEVRRRKMAKVMRTLGENVPPELVFAGTGAEPSTPRASAQRLPRSRQRKASASVDVSTPSTPMGRARTPRKANFSVDIPTRSRSRSRHHSHHSHHHVPSESTTRISHVPFASIVPQHHHHHHHHSHSVSPISTDEGETEMDVEGVIEVEGEVLEGEEMAATVCVQGQGWYGEWNRRDMAEVQRALRALGGR